MSKRWNERVAVYTKAWSVLLMVLCLLSPNGLNAQAPLDLTAIIHETQRMSQAPDEVTLVWWLPEQFWQASLAQDPKVGKAQVEQILQTVRPYTMIAVVDGKMGAFGGLTYRSEEAVRTSILLKDDSGETYLPLSESAIDPDARNLLQIMRPLIGNILGPLGQNLHFVLFQGKPGRAVADPEKPGSLRVLLGEKEMQYRLPLGSVLPPKYDARTRERFPGNYNFNPYTGTPLSVSGDH